METPTTKLNDSMISAACDVQAERVVFGKMAAAVMPNVPPEKAKIVQLAEARALAFAAGKSGVRPAADAPADTALQRACDRLAAGSR